MCLELQHSLSFSQLFSLTNSVAEHETQSSVDLEILRIFLCGECGHRYSCGIAVLLKKKSHIRIYFQCVISLVEVGVHDGISYIEMAFKIQLSK